MSADRTQQQSSSELSQARDLSLKGTRPPLEVPGYEAESLLGQGAYGEVWSGVDKNTGRQVAIKFYAHHSGVDWTLLSREVEKLVYLSTDRYVVQLLDVGWEAKPPYYVMEFMPHGSLEAYLEQNGTLRVPEAVEMFSDIAVGLLHAHGKGVLHCDLKPANILLDQDNSPRLADFGQSRLSHEQSPALGTLFYMAPEQADLEAVPDARWDVYALGAIMYCMLTGAPPFRDETQLKQIQSATDLPERLRRYQSSIRSAPVPAEHRQRGDVDRRLAEIIDRCLAVDAERRYPNVQSVIDDLSARDEARVRRPLLTLGFGGPLLLLAIMVWFAIRGYHAAIGDAEEMVRRRARESSQLTAQFAAASIEGEISDYFQLVREEANQPELKALFQAAVQQEVVQRINEPEVTSASLEGIRPAFIANLDRQALEAYLQKRLNRASASGDQDLRLASMFALDTAGRMLAVAYDDPDTVNKSIGWNYSYRTYFHSGPSDLAADRGAWQDSHPAVVPIEDTHFSAAFKSTTTNTWKVAISHPLRDQEGNIDGVLAITVNLGDFAYFRRHDADQDFDRFAVLIDGREGKHEGVILQHPRLGKKSQERTAETETRVDAHMLALIESDPLCLYRDPLADSNEGERQLWIAALEKVRLPGSSQEPQEMIVLVQESYDVTREPVRMLGGELMREGFWALVGVGAVVFTLLYVLMRALSQPRSSLRRRMGKPSAATPVQNLTTLAAQPRDTRSR